MRPLGTPARMTNARRFSGPATEHEMNTGSNPIHTVEAIYNIQRPEGEWLAAICEAARLWHDCGFGTMAWTFSIRPGRTWIGAPAVVGGRPEFVDLPMQYMAKFGARTTREAYSSGPCTTGLKAFPHGSFAELCPPGVGDFLATLGISPEGLGVMLGAAAPAPIRLGREVKYRSERVAAHLASAYRLRVRLQEGFLASASPEDADAVLKPDGALLHAKLPCQGGEAQAMLRQGVQAIDRARGTKGRLSPQEALDAWRALVAGRWSLVDHFESDGRRYVVALENPPGVTDPRQLTLRERQVASFAALGNSGKQIAYSLGLSPSRVSRHLSSAVRKLGLSSTVELPAYFGRLLQHAQRQAMSPGQAASMGQAALAGDAKPTWEGG